MDKVQLQDWKRNQLWSIVKEFPDKTHSKYVQYTKQMLIDEIHSKLTKRELNASLKGGLDIQKFLTKTFPNTEIHIPGYHFCGPGSRLDKRLKNFNPETGENDGFVTPPINQLDSGCFEHDIAYTKSSDIDERHKADRKLIEIADSVLKNKKSTLRQKLEATITKRLLQGKLLFGGDCDCHCLIDEIVQDVNQKE